MGKSAFEVPSEIFVSKKVWAAMQEHYRQNRERREALTVWMKFRDRIAFKVPCTRHATVEARLLPWNSRRKPKRAA